MSKVKTVAKHVLIGGVCFLAGCLALLLTVAVGMASTSNFGFLVLFLDLIFGCVLCGYIAHRTPSLWFLWPLLFGSPFLAIYLPSSVSSSPGWTLFWRSLAVAFVVFPFISSAYGSRRKRAH
jgi:hypothetical protein